MEWFNIQNSGIKHCNESIAACVDYALHNDLSALPVGRYDISEGAYLLVQEYETRPEEEKRWEAHRAYIDLQLVIKGTERFHLNQTERMDFVSFDEAKDFVLLSGTKAFSIDLREGDCVVCYPCDAHKPGTAAGEPQQVKKAVFKVKVK